MNSNNNASSVRTHAGGGKKIRNDVLFIGILLVVLILAGLGFFLLREEGDVVEVTVDGELYGVYSLLEDTVVEIRTGKNGEAVNRLVIRNGEAFVEHASCPDGICADHRPIFRERESIVCLPHRVVITVRRAEGTAQAPAPDIVI